MVTRILSFARFRFMAGFVAALGLFACMGEVYLRTFPPKDLHPFLGEASPLTGIYRADPDLGFTYRSFADFAKDNEVRLATWRPLSNPTDSRPMWAMFGNSFVHMEGMLADTARARVPDRAIFNLGRNEWLPLRFSQVKLLLEEGLRPQRIFFSLMPIDGVETGRQPLASCRITSRGALTYAPTPPPWPFTDAIVHSRLALTGWCRTGLHAGNPRFRNSRVTTMVGEPLASDFRRLFSVLADTSRKHSVPVTVMLLPSYDHIMGRAPCGFQDALKPMLQELGLDVFDPRDAFKDCDDKPGLFIPDRHFSARGNEIVLRELLAHVRYPECDRTVIAQPVSKSSEP